VQNTYHTKVPAGKFGNAGLKAIICARLDSDCKVKRDRLDFAGRELGRKLGSSGIEL
jgi:hypothetical protein